MKAKDRKDRYVFGRPADKDRDQYSRAVVKIESTPTTVLTLAVTLTLECGHERKGQAAGEHKRVPKKLFCPECHRQAAAAAAAAGKGKLPKVL